MAKVTRDNVVEQLRWRYAVKQFDPEAKIADQDWDALRTSVHLTPSSFGLQPWRFIVVTKASIKQQLRGVSWGQGQTVDCSHLVIMAAQQTIDEEHVDRFLRKVALERGVTQQSLQGYRRVILQFVNDMPVNTLPAWTARQVYIALGQLMTAAAMMGIDACPMEGIDTEAYDKILGLDQTGFSTVVACALGYRAESDASATQPKVRFDIEEVFQHFE